MTSENIVDISFQCQLVSHSHTPSILSTLTCQRAEMMTQERETKSQSTHMRGRMTRRMAFSCTCQPQMKDANAHSTIPRTNP